MTLADTEPGLATESTTGSRRRIPWVVVFLVAAPTAMIFLVMSGAFGGFVTGSLWRFPDLFVANTPTGGDMGAHVLLPKILAEELLPAGRILGWSNDWYAGFPVLYFYFPLPALTIVALDLLLPYGVAFKLVTVAGLVALPSAVYFLVRSLGFPRLVAAMAATTGGMYVFMESFSIFGGNIKSTLAGEYSFSWSFALSLVYLGFVARHVRRRRPAPIAPGVALALTALSHIVTTMVAVVASLPYLARRGGLRTVVGSWALGFALAGFWAVPLLARLSYTTDMGWNPVRNVVGDASPGSPLPGEFLPVLVLGVVGLVWTLLRRDDVAGLAAMTLVPLAGYFLLAVTNTTKLYNARLLPYWYLGMWVFAGIALGLGIVEISRRFRDRVYARRLGAVLVGILVMGATAVAIHDVPGWVKWNYEGYEGKEGWAEYRNLMETVDALPPGRIMWEANNDMNRYGTPMALMLFPYWSKGHPSMEGLFFESSLTTPFHFLNASEVSERPSNPVRGLRYRGLDWERALPHLALYDVAYFVSYTERGADEARRAGLTELAVAEPWRIFALPESSLVEVAAFRPAVWAGEEGFVEAALDWYDDVDHLDHWLVEDGPASWDRITEVDDRLELAVPYLGDEPVVSDVVVDDLEVSFRTTAVGVPHLVKVSYFPNWRATGAEGPYRAAPSLMVVVPTQEQVTLQFVRRGAENLGMVLTLLALVGIGVYLRRRGTAS
ncbi:MAG TPA: hypothetical protein ENK55_11370 [Actinobacteria bacterium]|nr:hypothetical protein [Actinomycetota bacterium]